MFCSRVRSGFLRTIFLRCPEMTIIFVQIIENIFHASWVGGVFHPAAIMSLTAAWSSI
jgi:hypothetical protein